MAGDPNRSTALARVLVDELVRGGLREAVVCPGSRNAPLSYALHAADAAGRLRLHVRIDERSAAFLALGLAVGSGAPVAVTTTSGTAVANLHPAVLEAAHSGVPLVVLSADRPAELLGSGANQTVEQANMFGAAVRAATTVAGTDPARWRAAVCRVLAAATGARTGDPGPAHLNVAFTEPLTPDGDGYPHGRSGGGPWTAVARASLDAPLHLDLARRTLVVAGAGARRHTELDVLPTVAEPGAPAPELSMHPLAVPALQPEQVLVLGRPTLHRDVAALLGSGVPVHVLADVARWPDVAAAAVSVGNRAVISGSPDPQWLRTCARVCAERTAAVTAVLDEPGPVTGLHVAAAVAAALAPGDVLVLGSSNPVRDASMTGLPKPGVRVLVNRGAAGIDGTVSTAVGAALVHAGRSVALIGDLTFLHDSNGLLIGPSEARPDLTLVVADDGGGGIFATLEQGAPEHAAAFERMFATPHGCDLRALCAGYGVAYHLVGVAEIAERLAQAHRGIRVLHVRTERAGLRALHDRLRG